MGDLSLKVKRESQKKKLNKPHDIYIYTSFHFVLDPHVLMIHHYWGRCITSQFEVGYQLQREDSADLNKT
jgi:hypothetical protein